MSSQRRRISKLVVGWSERVDLPDWHISQLPAKIDTGARSSALHVTNVKDLGGRIVGFDVVLASGVRRRHLTARVSRIDTVRSSSGHQERRYFVRTIVQLGPIERDVELSLVSRPLMRFRMLLGRTALSGLLVDPSRAHVLDAGHS